jgi:DNA polymerase-3 subunit chi
MTEDLSYHLQNMTVDNVLPPLFEKTLERGWRIVVRSTFPERADALETNVF